MKRKIQVNISQALGIKDSTLKGIYARWVKAVGIHGPEIDFTYTRIGGKVLTAWERMSFA
jgi:hypothetical protein